MQQTCIPCSILGRSNATAAKCASYRDYSLNASSSKPVPWVVVSTKETSTKERVLRWSANGSAVAIRCCLVETNEHGYRG